MDDKTLGMVLGVDSKGNRVEGESMLGNREQSMKNTNDNLETIASGAVRLVNGTAKVEDLMPKKQ